MWIELGEDLVLNASYLTRIYKHKTGTTYEMRATMCGEEEITFIATYGTKEELETAFCDLKNAIKNGQEYYCMPQVITIC